MNEKGKIKRVKERWKNKEKKREEKREGRGKWRKTDIKIEGKDRGGIRK